MFFLLLSLLTLSFFVLLLSFSSFWKMLRRATCFPTRISCAKSAFSARLAPPLVSISRRKLSKVTPQALFEAIDTDNSGKINQVEFNEAIDAMNAEELRDYS